MTDSQKFSEVKLWLQEAFRGSADGVPAFECTPRTVAELHRLALLSTRGTQAADIVAADLQERAKEYERESARLREILEGLGLAIDAFSQDGASSIRTLATTADHLNLKDTETSSFLLAMSSLSLERAAVDESRRAARAESDAMLEQTRRALAKLAHLRRVTNDLEDEAALHASPMKTWTEYLSVMASKERQYQQQLANYKAQLARSGYTPEVSHSQLLQLAEQHTQLVKRTEPLLAKLASYQDLPADKALAELAIEEKRRALNQAELRLEDALAAMAVL